jgi:hypothetical protein
MKLIHSGDELFSFWYTAVCSHKMSAVWVRSYFPHFLLKQLVSQTAVFSTDMFAVRKISTDRLHWQWSGITKHLIRTNSADPAPLWTAEILLCMSRDSLVSAWLRAGRPGFDPRQRERVFLLVSASISVLGPTQPPVQWVPGVLSPGAKRGRGVTLTTYPHLVPRSRTSRSYTSPTPEGHHGVQRNRFTLF